jgi:hypothetical protein
MRGRQRVKVDALAEAEARQEALKQAAIKALKKHASDTIESLEGGER